MWELTKGRRSFWDQIHDTELIIEICDGLQPPIDDISGYIELIKECWNLDPINRPKAKGILNKSY